MRFQMPMAAKGLAKLSEELGELQQVVGKRLAYYHTRKHPDGAGDLDARMMEEMGDVMAAIFFVAEKFNLSFNTINTRRHKKLTLFRAWDADPNNNIDGVDAPRAED